MKILHMLVGLTFLAMLSACATPSPDGKVRTANVVNRGTKSIVMIRTSLPGENDFEKWGADWLPFGALEPGQNISLDPDRGDGTCIFDLHLRFVGSPRMGYAKYASVDLCEMNAKRLSFLVDGPTHTWPPRGMAMSSDVFW
jgi:hypothetical protein